MKIARLLAITILLLNRRKVTAKELAEEFDVSLRTIYRDIDSLNAAGIPVVSWQGYEGGYCIPDSYKLSKQLFTFDNLLSVLSTLKGVNRTINNCEVADAIEKLTALVPEKDAAQFNQHHNSFIVDITHWGSQQETHHRVQEVHEAVLNSQKLKFTYTNANGGESERIVEPYTLAYKGFGWYLLAFCCLRGEFRVFKLNRMESLELLQESFVRKEIDPEPYFASDYDSRPPVSLRLKFSNVIQFRVEEMFSRSSIEQHENYSIVSLELPEDEWFYSMLLSFGAAMEVLEPQFVRDELRKRIRALSSLY